VSGLIVRLAAESSISAMSRRSPVSGFLALTIHHTAPCRYQAGCCLKNAHAFRFALSRRFIASGSEADFRCS
jgi:hypothetical protein